MFDCRAGHWSLPLFSPFFWRGGKLGGCLQCKMCLQICPYVQKSMRWTVSDLTSPLSAKNILPNDLKASESGCM